MKKSKIIFISIALVLCLSIFSACGMTTARWQSQYSDTNPEGTQDVSTVSANPSAKYIVYAALDSNGDLIASGSETEIAAYAVVGYTGQIKELVIPAQYNGKNVTKVLIATPYSAYKCFMNGAAYSGDDARLDSNQIVTSIVFGSNVTFVGPGVCAGMTSLASAHFDHVAAGVTYTDAFLGLSVVPTFRS